MKKEEHKKIIEKFDSFVKKHNGYIDELWESFFGGRGGHLYCPACEKDKQGVKVFSHGDENDMNFWTDGSLLVSLKEFKKVWYMKFDCSNCETTHQEFKKIFNFPKV